MVNLLLIFLECSVSMTVLAFLYQVLTPMLSKRYAAQTLYYGWLIIAVGFIIPFRPHLSVGLIPTLTSIQQTNGNSGFSPLVIASAIWISGSVAVLVYQLFMHYRFIKSVNRWGEKLNTLEILKILKTEQRKTGVSVSASIYKCQFITSPLLIGLRHPKILLPSVEFTVDELSMIIRHELIHFRRKDIPIKFIILLATALHWCNPAIWYLSKAISILCEISCDNETMLNTSLEQRIQYSETLIGVIRQSKPQTVFASNFYCSKQGLKNRIVSVMDMSIKNFSFGIIAFVAVLVIATGSLISHTHTISQPNGVEYEFNGNQDFDYQFD